MSELQLVICRIGREEYGLPIMAVQEINRLLSVTRMPQMPDFMEGIINLRGKIIPVVDLRKRFGMPADEHDENTRIVVIDVAGRTTGVIVDAVNEVIRLTTADVEPAPPAAVSGVNFISGICKVDERLIILLDVTRLFSEQENEALAAHEQVA
ncbi:MAG: chemotaxis protein CheW [Negativicutes bacterium]|nr:chemotaxis protein CheW [Negativicutes bacterium]